VNGQRQKRDRNTVTGSRRLAAAAEQYARTLARHREIGHHVGGTSPEERCTGFAGVRENIVRVSARGRPDRVARRAVEWWLGSPDHCDTLLQRDMSHDGVGVWLHHGDAYIVHEFAPAEQAVSGGLLGGLLQ